MLLNPLGGRVGDGGDGRAAPGEEHQARAAVVGVRTAFDVARALEGSRNLDAKSTQELLARLEAEGLIRGDTEVDLTVEGKAMHQSLREYIAGPTIRLLGQFDIQDIETTVRTMQAITRLAEEESSSPAT